MYTDELRVSDYSKRYYKMHINASWITIRDQKTNDVLFSRVPQNDDWYDAAHQRIVDAMRELENAVFAAAEMEK